MLLQSGRFGSATFDPLTLNPYLWFDFSDAATVTIATGISQINDKSGNSRHATQGTGAKQPAYATSAINGLNASSWNGTSMSLNVASVTLAQPYTIFAVAKGVAADTLQRNIVSDVVASAGWLYKIAASKVWALYAGSSFGAGVTDNGNTHVFAAEFNGASSELRIDTTTSVTGNPGSGAYSAGTFRIGGESQFWNGYICEVLLCTTPSTTLRDQYIAALMTKWGVA